jgi:hypothetical protein
MNLDSVNPFDLPFVPLRDRKNLPAVSGIYFVISRREILYVGQSKNILIRWLSHSIYDLALPYVTPVIAWLPAKSEFLDEYENYFISRLKPFFNYDPSTKRRSKYRYSVCKEPPRMYRYVLPKPYDWSKHRYGRDWSLRVVLASQRVTRIKLQAELRDRFSIKVSSAKLRQWCNADSIPSDIDMTIVDAIVSVVGCHPEELVSRKKLKGESDSVAA